MAELIFRSTFWRVTIIALICLQFVNASLNVYLIEQDERQDDQLNARTAIRNVILPAVIDGRKLTPEEKEKIAQLLPQADISSDAPAIKLLQQK